MTIINEYKQIRTTTCGISVLRNMIYDLKKIKYTEEDMINIVNDYNFDDKNFQHPHWKKGFISTQINGPMPTIKLLELLKDRFQIPCEILENVETVNIKPPALAVLINNLGKDEYHAIYIKRIDQKNNTITYMDPSKNEPEIIESVSEIDKRRNAMTKDNKKIIAEILSTK
jgi:hypothetical protein